MKRFLALLIGLTVFAPKIVWAHGVGQTYTLPVPLGYYLGGAAAAVALSFIVVAVFLKTVPRRQEPHLIRISILSPILKLGRIICVFFLGLTIMAGIFGNQLPTKNFAPFFFWFYFLIGTGVVSVVVGNSWDHFNPWRTLSRWVNGPTKSGRPLRWLGLVSVVLLLAEYWWELASVRSYVPMIIGLVLLIYTIFNIVCDAKFGEAWWKEGEMTSVVYRFIGRLAVFRLDDDDQGLLAALPTNALDGTEASPWLIGIAAILLAGTTFDGLGETKIWWGFLRGTGLQAIFSTKILNTFGLLILPLLFLAVYLVACWCVACLTKSATFSVARRFVWSLAPVAFGYALAHNFSITITSIPMMVGLFSDPFGLGWNLFGTNHFGIEPIILAARFIWFMEIALVVVAHVLGILFAHFIAIRLYPRRQALLSQIPLALLMILYTVVTLWMLSQPLTV